MNQQEAPIIVGLDIGTTKIVAIAARKNQHGKLEIVGFGKAPSVGVHHGLVQNIIQTTQSISNAITNCLNSNPELEIKDVYVGIAGKHIRSFQTPGELLRQDAEIEITKEEVDLLINNQKKTCIPAGDQIIDVIPQEYYIDKTQNIREPIGCNGSKLGAKFHIITGDKNAIRNINRSVEKSGLKIKDLVLQPLASAAAVMSDEDLEAGVAILDIGGGTSDLAVYCEGILKHTEVIPFGGENITEDIQKGLGILKSQAEFLKIKFGSALAAESQLNSVISIPGIRETNPKEISVYNLARIIQARMQEILEHVAYILEQKGFNKNILNYGIILTGGGSQLDHIIQLTEYITSLNARIGYPNEYLVPNHKEELKKPMYATCIGLILQGYEEFEQQFPEFNKQFRFIEIPLNPQKQNNIIEEPQKTVEPIKQPLNTVPSIVIEKRKSIFKIFREGFKTTLIDLF
ncbi:MAG: cell division protein FtsA, partial [Sediminibacterium sp.]|nr:cell division protein FtsA [Sediminibacterium sp.]